MSERILARRKAAAQTHAAGDVTRIRRAPSPVWRDEPAAPDLAKQALQSEGQALPAATRSFMEPRLGHDFSQVRVHSDTQAAEAAEGVDALAYTVGQDIVFGQGQYTPSTAEGQRLIAHELTHVAQQSRAQPTGHLMVGAANDEREQEAEHMAADLVGSHSAPREHLSHTYPRAHTSGLLLTAEHLVQRQPAHKTTSTETPEKQQGPANDVISAYKTLFDNQRSGLERLGKALNKKKPETSLIAELAAVAVGLALTELLGPVGPAAEALVLEEDEVSRQLVKKAADTIVEKTVDNAKERVKDWVSEPKKTDPIDNFVEAQSLAINRAERAAVHEFNLTSDGILALPKGPAILFAMADSIDKQADSAESIQMAHSAGQWASLISEPGDDSKAWANDDYERYAEKGALEIEAEVKKAPISGPEDIEIKGANWRGINTDTERVIQEHAGAKIDDLGTNLRISISTPFGETFCELRHDSPDPIIPEKSTLQGAMAWLITGEYSGALLESDRARVISAAAVLGYYMRLKPVSDLHFE